MYDFKKADKFLKQVEDSIIKIENSNIKEDELLVGVDLGTAYVVIVVLDKDFNPIACEMEFSQVVKDGLVVDYIGAIAVVKRLKEKLENRLGVSIKKAATAVPPGTSEGNQKTHVYVVEGAGIEVVNVVDEPTAANNVLDIKNGVIVDIGGGTTGLSIFKDSDVIFTADEATGGTHLTLVLAGGYGISFEEAEDFKKSPENQKNIMVRVLPVIQKMSSIVGKYIKDYDVSSIFLVGGSCCLEGIEEVFYKELGIDTFKPFNPFLVTPSGIAMSAKGFI